MNDRNSDLADAIAAALAFGFELADLAASLTRGPFGSREFATRLKPDGSPVTNVDLAVERALRDRITGRFPTHAVLGEEFGSTGDSDWLWYLDPIDGTADFVAGGAAWATLIAMAHCDEIVVGVVDFPVLGERWWASRGGGAFRNGEKLTVSTTSRLRDAVVSDDWHETIARGVSDHPLAAVAAHGAHIRPHQGDSLLTVASGDADVAVGTGAFSWDYAPTKVIVEEAGGAFTDLGGGDRIDADAAIVTNGLLHEQVLAVLAAIQPYEGRRRSAHQPHDRDQADDHDGGPKHSGREPPADAGADGATGG